MNVGRTQRRILLYALLPALAFYLGLRLFAQYRPVPVYVTRAAPMPAELASRLHMQEHKISPMVSIETPYAQADDFYFDPNGLSKHVFAEKGVSFPVCGAKNLRYQEVEDVVKGSRFLYK